MERGARFNYKIYVITSPSGRQYVGITMRELKTRWKAHINAAYSKKEKWTCFGQAIRKYGKDNFYIECLDRTNSRYKAGKLETFYIKKLNTHWPNGYNMTIAGCGGVPGFKQSEKFKLHLSKIKKEYYSDINNRKKQSIRATKIYNTPEGKEMQKQRAFLQNKPEIKKKIKTKLKEIRSTKEYKEAKSIEQKQVWDNPILKKKLSNIIKEQYKNGRVTWNKGKKTGLYRGKTLEQRKLT